MNLKDTYNAIAEDWVKDHEKDDWWQSGADVFLSMLPKGAHVLDVGCGGGIKTRYISEKGYGATGIDFSEEMIKIARRDAPELGFRVMDVYDIDKYQGTFDGIFAQAVLLHIPKKDTESILEKLKRKLNSSGLLYVAVKQIKDDGIEEKTIKENDYGYEYERFFSFYTVDELKGYFRTLGLSIVWEQMSLKNSNWLQIIGKKQQS